MRAGKVDPTIYLDHNASTPCDPRVIDEMAPLFGATYANPASRSHRPGQRAAEELERARHRIARALGAAHASEIVLTSGATEANNLALRGLAEASIAGRRQLVTQVTEHPSVLRPLRRLERQGWRLTLLPVERDGRLDAGALAAAVGPDTLVVSLMLANNETGAVQPVAEAAAIAHRHGALVHCDAAQGPGKLEIDIAALDVDLLTFSGHKAYGPKGSGGLYVRRRRPPIRLAPLLEGGGQESGLRSGTPNLPAMVGLARALEIACDERGADADRIGRLRDLLERLIIEGVDGCRVNGPVGDRLPGTSNLSFAGVDAGALLASLPDLAVSSGSACTSDRPAPSPVLLAMGVPRRLAAGSLRFSLGRFTTADEVARAAGRIVEEVRRLRAL